MNPPIVRVSSRAEFEAHLREKPRCLRAARPELGPRVGHPAFIGPIDPAVLRRPGALYFLGHTACVDMPTSDERLAKAKRLGLEGDCR